MPCARCEHSEALRGTGAEVVAGDLLEHDDAILVTLAAAVSEVLGRTISHRPLTIPQYRERLELPVSTTAAKCRI
jgi:hypothetical protein